MEQVTQQVLPTLLTGLTKLDLKIKADQLVDSLYTDEVDPMQAIQIAEAVSAAEEFLEAVRKNPKFVNLVRDIIGSDKKGYVTSSGAKITQAETGTKYDYSADSTWCKLKAACEEADRARKERETLLQAVTKPDTVADGETGGFIQPPIKTSTSNYKLSLKAE